MKRQRILEATKKKYGYDKVLNICTFKTEGSKSSILTAAKGLGIDHDAASYIASLIPVKRGKTTELDIMVYGDKENNIKPDKNFISECNQYPKLLECALAIYGSVCGRSIHASGLIIFETPYNDHNAMMKSTNKQPITQFDMNDSSYMGGLKLDFLTISNLSSLHICLNELVRYGYIEWQGSLRTTYDKYFHPDVLDYDSEKMWDMAAEGDIVNLFQFQTQIGGQAIRKIRPHSLTQLGVANAVMRLSVDGEEEQPIDTYVRYKNDINEWYKCMEEYQLTPEEVAIVEKHLLPVNGMATMQEEVMQMVMDEHISNFDMKNANYTRKSIAKKSEELQEKVKAMFIESGHSIGTSENLLRYVWNEVIKKQLGYSFSLPHILGYSTIAVQEMNMAYHYPIIYWNVSNLIVDSGSNEELLGQSTNYGKIATAIADMTKRGINITLPLINSAEFEFVPEESNNRIIYSLKALCGIGDDLAKEIVEKRPYASLDDFISRCDITPAKIIRLIKAGCFTELDDPDRRVTMEKYIRNYLFEPNAKLTTANLDNIEAYGMIPESMKIYLRIKRFKDYVLNDAFLIKEIIIPDKKVPKCGYHDRIFVLDETSLLFYMDNFTEDAFLGMNGEYPTFSEKKFMKEWKLKIDVLRDWLNQSATLDLYNEKKFTELWNDKASGTIPQWEMESLSYYYTEHELVNIDESKYGVVNYFELPEEPEPYEYYTRYINGERKQIPKLKISRVAGTVIDSDNNRHTIALLTQYGVVNVKFNKGQYVFYNRQISAYLDGSDKKTVLEKSWFQRGSKLLICGYRQDDIFRAYRYTDTVYMHTTNKILTVDETGDMNIQTDRIRLK